MTKTYEVSTITSDNGNLVFGKATSYSAYTKAQKAAKKLAGRGSEFTSKYGPTSHAYIGNDITAVIAW